MEIRPRPRPGPADITRCSDKLGQLRLKDTIRTIFPLGLCYLSCRRFYRGRSESGSVRKFQSGLLESILLLMSSGSCIKAEVYYDSGEIAHALGLINTPGPVLSHHM
jgi:hypothetical protein